MSPPRNVSALLSGQYWRLEAFDLRAGLAFATWREEQTATQEVQDWPCLFFSPPNFTPEPVDNVAAALGATRGCFSSGLFVGDREAFFKTPEEVTEFLRRAYVASAGGDGADGGGDEGGPIPPTEPPDLPLPERLVLTESDRHQRTAAKAMNDAVHTDQSTK